MDEIVEMLVNELPFLVVLAQLAAVIFQEIAFHAVLVQEVVAVVHDGLIPSAPYGFGLFCHGVIEGSLPCVFRMGVNVNAQRFMPGDFSVILKSFECCYK